MKNGNKALLIFLCAAFALNLCACGASSQNSTSAEKAVSAVENDVDSTTAVINTITPEAAEKNEAETENTALDEETVTENPVPAVDPEYHITSLGQFHEGYAVITFESSGQNYIGCIDTDGNLKFSTAVLDNHYEYNYYENGYVFITYGDIPNQHFVAYDMNGNCTDLGYMSGETYQLDGGGYSTVGTGVVAVGNGYYVTQEISSDFDSSFFITSFKDISGNVVDEIQTDNPVSVAYYGAGFFWMSGDDIWPPCYVLTGNGSVNGSFERVEVPILCSVDNYCYTNGLSGEMVLGECDGENVAFMDNEGSAYEYTYDNLENSEVLIVGADYALVQGNNKTYYVINIRTGDCYAYDGKWEDKISSSGFSFYNGVTAFRMQGEDGNYYAGVVDSTMTELSDPISLFIGDGDPTGENTEFVLTENALYLENGSAYDLNGNVLDSLPSLDSYELNCDDGYFHLYIEEDTYITNGNSDPLYINTDGSVLIDTIDFSTFSN